MCFALRERGVTGALERQLESSEAQLDRFRRKTEQLHKQVGCQKTLKQPDVYFPESFVRQRKTFSFFIDR
jgi:hypothetical protein